MPRPSSPTVSSAPGARLGELVADGETWDQPAKLAATLNPTSIYRVRRKLRRMTNELRSIWEERLKRPNPRAWPVEINLNHTTICNLRCVMCEQATGLVPQMVMPRDVYERIREELFDKASEISLTVMGDPFCVPKPFFRELIDDIARFDLRLEITTNATLFGTDEELERVVRATSKMVISCDGATKETFERIRTPAKWEKTIANIERYRDIRRKLPFRKRPLTYFNYVLMKSNLDEFPLFVEHCKRWDAYSVTGSPMLAVHSDMTDEVIDPKDPHVLAVLTEARALADSYGMELRIPGIDIPRTRKSVPFASRVRTTLNPFRPTITQGFNYLAQRILHRVHVAPRECGFLWNKAYLQMDGRVTTCCHPQKIETGDVTVNSFQEIWTGKRYRAVRETLNTDHPAKPCRDCHLLRP